MLLNFSTLINAQFYAGFEFNNKYFNQNSIYNSCLNNWYAEYGTANVDTLKKQVQLSSSSGIFTQFIFNECKLYRITLDLEYSGNPIISIGFVNGLENSIQKEKPSLINSQNLFSKTISSESIILDSVIPEQNFTQLFISNESTLENINIKNIYIQAFCTDSIQIRKETALNNYIFSAEKIKLGTNINSSFVKINKGNTKLYGSDNITIEPGFEVVSGAVMEANLVKCKDESETCITNNFPSSPITIYNLITPVKDNKNDTWYIDKILDYENLVEVFDQAGNIIFRQENYQNNWEADNVPSGTYLYKITLKQANKKFAGNLVIQR